MVRGKSRLIAFLVATIVAQPGLGAPVADRKMAILAARLFPDLSSENRHKISSAVGNMLLHRRARFDACGDLPTCEVKAAIWTDAERAQVAQGVAAVAERQPAGVSPADRVRRQIDGINSVLLVYGSGLPPRYPAIDGPVEGEGSPRFASSVADAVTLARAIHDDPSSDFDPSIGLALALLDTNDRDDAGAWEPIDASLNAAAVARAANTQWSRFRYSAILVPGIGPDDLSTPLSARGKLNVRLAAQRFADGLAPFIIVSGGSVHPRGSRSTEAIEMRRALIDRYAIPADCIVVEPYARHTTTNLRNATRRLIAMKAPLDRDVLIVTNPAQSQYIESADFKARSLRDLGYEPGKIGARLSATDLAFRPTAQSSLVDPMDPLDP